MLSRLWNNALRPRFAVGLSLTYLSEGRFVADLCLLERRGEEVVVVEYAVRLQSAEAIKALITDQRAPIALAVHGRGILHRHTPNASANLSETVRHLLPGAKVDDFYVQVLGERSDQYVSLIRKEHLHQLLVNLEDSQLLVTDVTLGPSRFTSLLPYLIPEEVSDRTLNVAGYQFKAQVDPPLLRDISYHTLATSFDTANSDEVAANLDVNVSLPYALGVALFHSEIYGGLLPPAVLSNRREVVHRFYSPLLTWGLLGMLFVILLLNFFAFSYLNSQSQEVTSYELSAKARAATAARLQEELLQKEKFLRVTGWLEPSSHSIRADELAASIPAGIQLLTLESHPVDATATQIEHRQVFKPGVLYVKGQCRDAIVLNSWLQQLEKLQWVKSVREQTFAQDYAAGVGTFSFVLIVK